METLEQQLIRHEGYRQFPYKCSAGKLTIAIGRNLDDRGISEDEAKYMLHNDIEICKQELNLLYPIVDLLSPVRYNILINMCFNIGIKRLSGFKRMWAAIEIGDFEEASRQMLDSRWAKQVGKRAIELAGVMKNEC
ncbi:glycoside hydrolase family protein [Candidatus Pacearchaeota archaeon]|nr:glycoside hydrolase family protein [Candidatus Pacearchaeota archaeon]